MGCKMGQEETAARLGVPAEPVQSLSLVPGSGHTDSSPVPTLIPGSLATSKPLLEHTTQQAGTGGEQHPEGLTVISSAYLPWFRIQTPGAESTALAASPKTDPITAATQLSPIPLTCLKCQGLQQPVGLLVNGKVSWPLPIS